MENAIKLTCLVLEPVAVVAEDLRAMVESELPGTSVLVAGSADMAMNILRERPVDIVFVNLSPLELERSHIVERLEQTAASLVFMGHVSEPRRSRHRLLELPFVSSAIAEELRVVMRRMLGRSVPPGGTSAA